MLSLIGCSGTTYTNFAKPDADDEKKCTTNCVNVQLLAGRVQNLNYECDSVRGYTNLQGMALCPNGSTIKYYIKPKGDANAHKLELGQYKINFPINALLTGDNTSSSPLMRITTSDLTESDNSSKNNNTIAAENTLRLLLALGDANDSATDTPLVELTDAQKLLLNDVTFPSAETTVSTTDSAFKQVATDWLKRIDATKQLKNDSQITSYLARAQNVLKAGMYTSNLTTVAGADFDAPQNWLAILGSPSGGAQTSTSPKEVWAAYQLYALQDRAGRAIGYMTSWTSTDALDNNADLPSKLKLLPFNTKHALLRPVDNQGLFDNDGNVQQRTWNKVGVADESLTFTAGKIKNFTVLYGNKKYYEKNTGQTVVDADLGKFKAKARANTTTLVDVNGQVNLQRTFVVDDYLRPDVFLRSAAGGGKVLFPLHLKLSFAYDANVQNNPKAINDLQITILDDGNIITDLNADCSAVDPTTMQDKFDLVDKKGQTTERPIGLIRTADKNTDNAWISIAILLSGAEINIVNDNNVVTDWRDGIQFGSSSSNVGLANVMLKSLLDDIQSNPAKAIAGKRVDIVGDPTATTLKEARWANVQNAMLSSYYSTEKITATGIDAERIKQTEGILKAQVASCQPL